MAADFSIPPGRALGPRRLDGRAILVAGAGSDGPPGVGAAIAFLFARHGARVGVLDVSAQRARATIDAIGAAGGEAIALVGDIRDLNACSAAVEDAQNFLRPISGVVNSAALVRAGDVESVQSAAWRETLDTTLDGALNVTRAVSADLKRTRGAIVNVSSVASSHAFGSIAYATAKAGLEAMTREMALTLGPHGVRANAIALGPISSPMVARIPEPQRSARRAHAMLSAEGDIWDAAFAALFLISEEARWITGHTLRVDAGVSVSGRARAQAEES